MLQNLKVDIIYYKTIPILKWSLISAAVAV